MASYVVMEPPEGTPDERAANARLIRDGFGFLAFLVPLFWFLFHRMWIEALLTFALMLAIGLADDWMGLGWAATATTLLLSLLVGLEASSLRAAALSRRGWRQWGVVEARSRAEAEMRYLEEWEAMPEAAPVRERPVPSAPASVPLVSPRPTPRPALGMFDYPGGR